LFIKDTQEVAHQGNARDGARRRSLRRPSGAEIEAISISADMNDEESVRPLARETLKHYGRLDILIDTPAIPSLRTMRPFDEIPVEEWDAPIAATVRGVFLCCKAAAGTFRAQRPGKIINLISTAFDPGTDCAGGCYHTAQ
jgi:NAD(P)-dependent dehydrogenase (short-subunit alcohol dehydrogenase family)